MAGGQSSEIAGSLVPLSRADAMLLLEAGYLLLDMGIADPANFDKARDVFVGVAALMPKSDAPQIALGTLELAQGRFAKALQAYRSAQKLAPRSGLPRAHAGEALLFMGKVAEAVKELRAAMQVEPEGDGAKLAAALLEAKDAGAFPGKTSERKG